MATIAGLTSHANPPGFAAQTRKNEIAQFMDEIFGVSYIKTGGQHPVFGMDEQNKWTQSLPETLVGRNKTNLGERMHMLMLLADNFYTQILAPIRTLSVADNIEITWDEITFNPILPGVTPEQGRTRIATWNVSSQGDVLQRLGLGAEFDYGFMLDPRGQQIARGCMDQINTGVEEGMKFGVMKAYLRCGDLGKAREAERFEQTWSSQRIEEMFKREMFYFGILQRDEKAVNLIDSLVTEEQKEYGGQGDTYLIHWKMAMYVTIINPLYTEFSRGGERAVSRLDRGIDAFGKWGTSDVFIVRAYDVDVRSGAVDLLRERVNYGEYHLAFNPALITNNYTNYNSNWRSVQLLDGDLDDYTTITLKEMAQASGRWDENGRMIGVDDSIRMKKHQPQYDARDMRDSFHYTNSKGELVPARRFGHINVKYYPVPCIMNLARTVTQSATNILNCYSRGELASSFKYLHEARRVMEMYEHDEFAEDFLLLVHQQNMRGKAGETHPGNVGCPPTVELREWIPNKEGGLDLPELDGPFSGYMDIELRGNFVPSRPNDALPGWNFGGDAAVLFPNGNEGQVIYHHLYPEKSLLLYTRENATPIVKFSRALRLKSHYALPPFYGNGNGFRTIASTVKRISSRDVFEKKYGFNYDLCKQIADSVDVIQSFVSGLGQVFLDNPFLDANFASSNNHRATAFDVFVENILGQARVPVWLYRGTLYKPSIGGSGGVADREGVVVPAADANDAGIQGSGDRRVALSTKQVTQALRELIGTSTSIATVVQDNFVGRMLPLEELRADYAAQLRGTDSEAEEQTRIFAGIPAVRAAAADLSRNSVGNPTEAFAFHPRQGSAIDDKFTSGVELSQLPTLMRVRLKGAGGLGHEVRYGPSIITTYSETITTDGVDPQVVTAVNSIVRLIANYQRTVRPEENLDEKTAIAFAESEAMRAMILTILGAVSPAPGKKGDIEDNVAITQAKRINNLVDNLFKAKLGIDMENMAKNSVVPVLNVEQLKHALSEYLSQPLGSSTAAKVVFGERDAAGLIPAIDKINQRHLNSLKELNSTITLVRARQPQPEPFGAPQSAFVRAQGEFRHDTANYMRTPLTASDCQFRSHWNYMLNEATGVRRIPIALLSDPNMPDYTLSPIDERRYAEAIAANDNLTLPAPLLPFVGSTSKLGAPVDAVPVVYNTQVLKKGVSSGKAGGASSISLGFGVGSDAAENQLREAENYARNEYSAIRYAADMDMAPRQHRVTSRHSLVDTMEVDSQRPVNHGSRPAQMSGLSSGIIDCLVEKSVDRDFLTDNFVLLWDLLDKQAQRDPVLAAIGKVFIGTSTDWKNWEAFIDQNIDFPMNFILARPFIVFHTMFILKVKKGQETAITWVARPVTSWGDEAQTQTYRLTLTYYTKTIVHNIKNVYRIPNAMIVGLERGFNCQFYSKESFEATSREINGQDSIFSLAEPYTTTKLKRLINLGGKHTFATYNFKDDPARNEESHYTNKYWANIYWGFQNMNNVQRSEQQMMNSEPLDSLNMYMWHGQTLYYNPNDLSFTYKRAAQGYIRDQQYAKGSVSVWKDATESYTKAIGRINVSYKPI